MKYWPITWESSDSGNESLQVTNILQGWRETVRLLAGTPISAPLQIEVVDLYRPPGILHGI